jgi:hypothetical protein
MKLDADEKELLESFERGEWKSASGGKRERTRYALWQGHVPQRSSAEYSSVEQGLGGDPEAGSRRGFALSDADRQPAAQVRSRAPKKRSNERGTCTARRIALSDAAGQRPAASGPFEQDSPLQPLRAAETAYRSSVSVPVAISAAAQITSRFIQARRSMPTPSFSNTSTAMNAVTAR